MSILIKNGRIITADEDFIGDIFIEGETVSKIGKNLKEGCDSTIDASGKLVFPGGIDPHVHFDLPVMGTYSSDNFETGTKAALFGGTTTIIDFANQTKGHSLFQAVNEWHKKAENNSYTDYSFHATVTDLNDNSKKEIEKLIKKEGITSFKVFMAYKDTLKINDEEMINIMNEVHKYGGTIAVHATNGDMIDEFVKKFQSEKNFSPLYHYLSQPEITEEEACGRFIEMANKTGVHALIVHMTCEGAINKVKDAALKNQKIFVETCIQYLLLDAVVYETGGIESAKYVLSPPLRLEKDRDALWAGIFDGHVDLVSTDHCPFTLKQKMDGINDFTKIPNGIPGVEHRVELLFSEGVQKRNMSLNKFVELTSTNAAKIYGMFPQKGTIVVGSDADIVIFDPEKKHTISAKTHRHNCDYSAYEGWQVTGKCKTVLLRGKIAVNNNKLIIDKGFGKFLKRAKSANYSKL